MAIRAAVQCLPANPLREIFGGMGNDSANLTSSIAVEMGNVLSRTALSAHDDFFLSGGDSLLAVKLIKRLTELFQLDDDGAGELRSELMIGIFDDATPAHLASIVGAR